MTEANTEFDFQRALKDLQECNVLMGKEGILTPLINQLTETGLEAEMDSHLCREIVANRSNVKSQKTIKSVNASFELPCPRDRDGSFSPQLVKIISRINEKPKTGRDRRAYLQRQYLIIRHLYTEDA